MGDETETDHLGFTKGATAMVPPAYGDLGKHARDIFNKGYHYGLIKLEAKTKTESGVNFTVSGASNIDTNRVNGSIETKYKIADYGLTLSEKWTTDNTLHTELNYEDHLAKGLKIGLDTTFAPETGKKFGRIKTAYKMDYVNLNADVDLDFAGPVVHGAIVAGHEGWLAGYQMSFDTAKSCLTRSNFAVGYTAKDFIIHTNVNDGQEFGGALYHKINDKLESGVQIAWTAGNTATRFGLAGKYKLDGDASISAKVNNSSQVGIGYTQLLRPGITLTLSSLIEGKNFNQGGHKIGMALDLAA